MTKEIDNSLNTINKHENEIQKFSKEKTQNEVILNSNKKQIKIAPDQTINLMKNVELNSTTTTNKINLKKLNKVNHFNRISINQTNTPKNLPIIENPYIKGSNVQQNFSIINSDKKNNLISKSTNDSIDVELLEPKSKNNDSLYLTNNNNDKLIQNSISKKKFFDLLLSLELGASFNSAKYTGDEPDFYSDNTSEKMTIDYRFNANLLIKNKFIIGTGVGLNQQKFNYNFQTSSIDYDTTITLDSTYIFDYYIYQQGVIVDSVYSYSYNNITTIDTNEILTKHNNTTTAKYFTIPLNIGYNSNYRKFMFNLVFSVNYNRLYDVNGGYYSNNSFELINMANNTQFKKSYLSYYFRANVSYNMINNFYINSSFGFSPYSSNVFNETNLDRRIQTFNLGLGLMYKL